MVSTRQIGKREIAALQPGQVIWDGAISGFGARRQVDAVSYVLFYRAAEGRQRWHTIGRHGSPWTPDTARREAKRLLGSVAGGIDPAALKQAKRSAQSVAELCDL
jgi:Arm DNA-binding domain